MLTALLAWYDEPPSLLRQCVESLNGTVDLLVAVDGAYRRFPEGRPRSPSEQVDAIHQAARMPVRPHFPDSLWEGQLAKRDFMFRFGERFTTGGDWFLIIDADETLDPGFPKHLLDGTEEDVGLLAFKDSETLDGLTRYRSGVRRLMRAQRGITLGPTHGDYQVGGRWLQRRDRTQQVPARDFRPHGLTHHRDQRPFMRAHRQSNYYIARANAGEELQACHCGEPASTRVWTDWHALNGRVNGQTKDVCDEHAPDERERAKELADALGVGRQLQRAGFL